MNWARGLGELPGIRLAARVRDAPEKGTFAIHGDVVSLPFYVGARQLIRTLPRLALATARAVHSSSIVVVRLPGPVGIVAALFARFLHRPLIVDVAGDAGEVWRTLGAGPLMRVLGSLIEWLTRLVVRSGKAVRYVTEKTLQRRYPPSPHAFAVGYSAVYLPTEWLVSSPSIGTSAEPSILAIGSQEQLYKGHDTLLRAFARIRAILPDARLTLAGGGRRQAELVALAQELGVAAYVDFTGHVASRDQIRELLDRAWVFSQPSRTEGLPRALVEAMARGKACVGTDAGGIPELLTPQCIVPVDNVAVLAERLTELLTHESMRAELGAHNLRRASDFSRAKLSHREFQWKQAVLTVLSQATVDPKPR